MDCGWEFQALGLTAGDALLGLGDLLGSDAREVLGALESQRRGEGLPRVVEKSHPVALLRVEHDTPTNREWV